MAVTTLLQDLQYFLFPSPSPLPHQQPIPTTATYNPPLSPSATTTSPRLPSQLRHQKHYYPTAAVVRTASATISIARTFLTLPPVSQAIHKAKPSIFSNSSRVPQPLAMHNTSQHGPLFHHSEAHSPHASTSRVALEVIPGQIYSPPRLSGIRHIPLPPTIQGYAELNPLLRSGHEVLIRYRIVAPPTAASAFGTNDHWMLEAATNPHLRSMAITTSGLIPWPIIVHASNPNPLVVTVGDVLTAVHDALHTLATECVEYQQVSHPNMVVASRHWNGMRRLSLLNGRHWWAGLSESQEGPEMWDLHLQR